MEILLWSIGTLFVLHVLFKGWIRFKTVINICGIGLSKDYEEKKKIKRLGGGA